jgi:hypothetical protein
MLRLMPTAAERIEEVPDRDQGLGRLGGRLDAALGGPNPCAVEQARGHQQGAGVVERVGHSAGEPTPLCWCERLAPQHAAPQTRPCALHRRDVELAQEIHG